MIYKQLDGKIVNTSFSFHIYNYDTLFYVHMCFYVYKETHVLI
jgi:hypothetical protein